MSYWAAPHTSSTGSGWKTSLSQFVEIRLENNQTICLRADDIGIPAGWKVSKVSFKSRAPVYIVNDASEIVDKIQNALIEAGINMVKNSNQ